MVNIKSFVWHWCNVAAKENGLECTHVNNDDFTVLVSGAVDAIEWACVLSGRRIQNDWVEQWICIKFCIKLEHSSLETIWMIQKAAAPKDNWWLAVSSRPHTHSCITTCAEIFGETSNYPGDSGPLKPRFGALQLLAFPKTKSPLKGKRFQTVGDM